MSISREVLAKYIKPGCTFIETGARWGDSCIRAIEAGAKCAWSCESDRLMATIAQMHCEDVANGKVVIENLDSVAWLSHSGIEVLQTHDNSVVFLDAHTDRESPIVNELNAIKSWRGKPFAIIIDDLRCMPGWGVDSDFLMQALVHMGYKVKLEHGVEPFDIMVGTR